VIIVAGGTGTRMGSQIPKQFLLLGNKPILIHTLDAFHTSEPDATIVIVLPQGEQSRWTQLLKDHHCTIPHAVVDGGVTRFHSVQNALAALPSEGVVAIHDGARPLVTSALIARAFQEAEREGNAVPAVPVCESMRLEDQDGNHPVDRSAYRLVQTPQVFLLSGIKPAYGQDYMPGFTDDATVMETYGMRIHLIEGDPTNIKITGSGDLAVAQALMNLPFQR
jgi:2-C-methyl-D-erythritol 4-phosphate cytidylyltransferase